MKLCDLDVLLFDARLEVFHQGAVGRKMLKKQMK
jgi:hypothetical protein